MQIAFYLPLTTNIQVACPHWIYQLGHNAEK